MDWSEKKCLRLKLREIKPMMQRRKITFKLRDHHIQGAQNGEQHVLLINWKNNSVTRIQWEKWHWLRTQLKCQEGVWLFGVLEAVGSSLDFFSSFWEHWEGKICLGGWVEIQFILTYTNISCYFVKNWLRLSQARKI